MTEQLHFHFSLSRIGRRKWQPTPVFLPGESQGRGSLVGCHLWGCTELDMTEVTLQHQQYFIYLLFQDSFFFLIYACFELKNFNTILKVTFHLPLLQILAIFSVLYQSSWSLSYTHKFLPLIPHPPHCLSLPFPWLTTGLFSVSVIQLHFCFTHWIVALFKILLISDIIQSLSLSDILLAYCPRNYWEPIPYVSLPRFRSRTLPACLKFLLCY